MISNTEQFYREFFKNGEGIAFQSRTMKEDGDGYWAKNNIRLQAPGMVSAINFDYSNFCINPVDPYHDNNPENVENRNKPRATKDNITAYRGMLIECDHLTPKQQTIRMTKSGMPYSAKVFSGNNSYHYTIFFDQDLTLDQYEATFYAIETALKGFGYTVDTACINPNRMTRAPFCKREGTDTEQTLSEFKGLVKYEDMLAWLDSLNVNIKPIVRVTQEVNYEGPGNADDEYRFTDAVNRTVKSQGEYGIKPRQPWLYRLACECKNNGIPKDKAINFISNEFHHDEPHKRSSAINNAYTYAKATLRTINVKQDSDDKVVDVTAPTVYERLPFESIIRVSGEFFQVKPSGRIAPIKPATICIDYGDKAHTRIDRNNIFDDFAFKPNIWKQERVIIEEGERKYNLFISPEWEKLDRTISDDEVKYSLHLCSRVFKGKREDQLEVGLDKLYIDLFKPETLSLVSVLGGPPETGKDTIMEWLSVLSGQAKTFEKTRLLDSKDLASQFNASWASLWFKCFNEVKIDPRLGIEEELKNKITAKQLKIELKGKDAYYIDNYSRFVIATNHSTAFMKVEEHENRYWLRILDPITKQERQDYPDYKENLLNEVPLFINWLYQRGLKAYPNNDNGYRFWFPLEAYTTNAMTVLKENSKSDLELAIEEVIDTLFRTYAHKDTLTVRSQSIKQRISENDRLNDVKVTNSTIKKILCKKYNIEPYKNVRVDDIDKIECNSMFFDIPRNMSNVVEVNDNIDNIFEEEKPEPKKIEKVGVNFDIFDPSYTELY